jgi:hypothetical protein
MLNPNPLICRPSPDQTKLCPAQGQTVICDECSSGYLVNETHLKSTGVTQCYVPPFGLNPKRNETTSLKSQLADLLQDKTVYVGQQIIPNFPAALSSESKRTVFAGYSETGLGYANITYELDFKGEDAVDITCGEIKIGDTLADGTKNEWSITHNDGEVFRSRESNLKFAVTKDGSVFSFDGKLLFFYCDSAL